MASEIFERCPCGNFAVEITPPTKNLGVGWRWFRLSVIRNEEKPALNRTRHCADPECELGAT